MEMRFNHLESLHWIWVIIGVVAVMVVGNVLRRRALTRFAARNLLERLAGRVGTVRVVLRMMLLVGTLLALFVALLDPRWGVTFQQVRQRGVDVMIVLDVSRSMEAEDVRPDRLARAKQHIRDLVEQCAGDRVGLVTFAGVPAVKCPLTVDYGAFLLSLDLVHAESAARGGSLLGDALRLAAKSFTDDVPDHKAIVVLTDGEDHGSFPLDAARDIAGEASIPIFTVGIGDEQDGARIPVQRDGQRIYLTYEGQEVWSKMNPELLRAIALASGGAYVPVGIGTVDMGKVYNERIAPIAVRDFEAGERKRLGVQYQWFVGLALGLLMIESWMARRYREGIATGVPV